MDWRLKTVQRSGGVASPCCIACTELGYDTPSSLPSSQGRDGVTERTFFHKCYIFLNIFFCTLAKISQTCEINTEL